MADNFPEVVHAQAGADLLAWVQANKSTIDMRLDECGALMFRGFAISTEAGFRDVVNVLSSHPLEYMYRSTPRTDLGNGVYTATEYPPGLSIPLHNENAYQRDWPLRLWFFCTRPADGGTGRTPLANTVKVTEKIDPSVRRKFMEKGVMYIRNYRSNIDLPWQTVFQTDCRDEVEKFCRNQGIECEWTGPDTLRTRQVCQAFATHPRTGMLMWFNQAHLFHPSSVDVRTREAMSEMFDESDFPRNATYGDGSRFDEADLDNIRAAFASESVTFQWQAGDVLLLDNMLVSHGRTPYKGQRRVLVAMCDLYSFVASSFQTLASARLPA